MASKIPSKGRRRRPIPSNIERRLELTSRQVAEIAARLRALEAQHATFDLHAAASSHPHEPLGAQIVAALDALPFDEVDRADLDAMKRAIEEGCERVDVTAW
jgi:hypothetical protein